MIHLSGTLPAVDVHTHLAPLLSGEQLKLVGLTQHPDGRYAAAAAPLGPPALYRERELLGYLDAQQLDEALVAIAPPFFRQDLDVEASASWVRAINDGLIARCSASERLRPLRYLPLEHPALAIELVREGLASDECAGWAAAAGGAATPLDVPELSELWSLLAADGRPLLLHPAESPDPRLRAHYLHNLLGNPVETGVAVGELVLGGVLAQHPMLRIILVHCGGVVPSVAARWQRGIDTNRPGVTAGLPPVAEQLGRVFTDCLTHAAENVDLARTVFGDSQLLLGSDWPFPMGLADPRTPIAHLDAELRERVARANPARLLSLVPAS